MTKIRIAAATAAIMIGLAAPATSAFAFGNFMPRVDPPRQAYERDALTTGSIGADPGVPVMSPCMPSPGAEGNAQMQERTLKNYGQTSGGYDCR